MSTRYLGSRYVEQEQVVDSLASFEYVLGILVLLKCHHRKICAASFMKADGPLLFPLTTSQDLNAEW
jgi:hypothetical protein